MVVVPGPAGPVDPGRLDLGGPAAEPDVVLVLGVLGGKDLPGLGDPRQAAPRALPLGVLEDGAAAVLRLQDREPVLDLRDGRVLVQAELLVVVSGQGIAGGGWS